MPASSAANRPMLTPRFVSYSANREDVLINRLFGAQPEGFYVDVGAAHPVYENDTKALYDRGWHGINIEPNQSFFSELTAARPRDHNFNLAVSDEPGWLTFHEVVGTGLSTCDPEESRRAAAKGFQIVQRQIKAETLQHILEEVNPSAIDLLKIDVEGLELQVLRSNDWSRFRPTLIVAEATYPDSPIRRPDLLTPFLAEIGYRRVYFDGLNDYFIENDFALPDAIFDSPPNVFDRIAGYVEQNLVQERDAALAYIASLESEIARAHEAIISTRNRSTALAEQLESMSIRTYGKSRESAGGAQRSLSGGGYVAQDRVITPVRLLFIRLLGALRRPRRTLRILLNGRGGVD